MNQEPLDLAALDRFPTPGSVDDAVHRIMMRAEPVLARRAAGRGVLAMIAAWAQPALAAAAVVAALSVAALTAPAATGEATGRISPVAEALELPAPVDDWVTDGRDPTAADLIVALEDLP